MFKAQNDKEREYFNQDFTPVNELLKRIRISLVSGAKLNIDDLDFTGIVEFERSETLVYLTLFQSGKRLCIYCNTVSAYQR